MPRFEPRDPFPLVAFCTAQEARDHAALCDIWLGLRVEETEGRLAREGSRDPAPRTSGDKHQLWFGLSPRDLLTPYLEIRSGLDGLSLKPGMTVVDLGAAYARMGFVLHRHHPGVRFIGYEYVGERVREGRLALEKFGARLAELQHVDLTANDLKIAVADVYFIYDYGTPKAVEKTLFDLKRSIDNRPVTVVARGRSCRYAIESRHSWLRKLDPAAPESAISIYTSRGADRQPEEVLDKVRVRDL